MLTAYIDDSYNPGGGSYVLAGFVSTNEKWEAFSKDWGNLLPTYGTLKPRTERYHFKMNEMAENQERMARLPAFQRVAEEHSLMAICCCLNTNDLAAAMDRIQIPSVSVDWGVFTNDFVFAFRCLMDMFHNNKSITNEVLGDEVPVQFIFDNQMGEEPIVKAFWNAYHLSRRPEIRRLYAEAPKFEDDEDFLPLQAADMLAWWVRRAYSEGRLVDLMEGLYEGFRLPLDFPKLVIEFDEDALAKDLIYVARENVGSGPIIYDCRIGALEL